ncbi:MAG: hypothetical protein KA139_12165 [Rhodobacteraceae bacterium]|nr:hypothetical protein [Paracoccaceae bacterium]
MRHFAFGLVAALWGTTALAQATPEGAAELTSLFQTYLGATPGVVTVAPEGEVYGVKLDFAPLLAKLPDAGAEASITPITFTLSDNGDDTWDMEQDQAFDLQVKVPGQMDLSVHIANLSGEGTFDEAIGAFTTSSTSFTDLVMNQKTTDPVMGENTVNYTIASGSYESTSEAGAAGGIDTASTYAMEGLTEVFSMPPMGEGAPPTEITLRAESYTGTGTAEGMRPDAIYKLLAFFVANPSEAAIAAQQGELKTILTDGLPLFDHLISTSTATAISVETPMGPAALSSAAITVEANGVVEAGLFREAFDLKGLELPAGLVPEWAVPLVPSDLSLDIKATRFNLLAPAKLILSALDLTKEPSLPPETEAQLLGALLPEGVVDVTLAPGGAKAPVYALTYEAAMSAGPMMPMPVGTAKLTLTGMAEINAALAAAPEDVAMQAGPMLAMAEGMAKPGDNGALVWEVEMTAEGALMVNGTNMMGAQ